MLVSMGLSICVDISSDRSIGVDVSSDRTLTDEMRWLDLNEPIHDDGSNAWPSDISEYSGHSIDTTVFGNLSGHSDDGMENQVVVARVLFDSLHGGIVPQGEVLENYELLCELGSGGYGSVWKAMHRETNQIVALKHYYNSTESVWHEAGVLFACMENPTIVDLRAVVCDVLDRTMYIVMELVGTSMDNVLHDLNATGQWFLEADVRYIMREILSGLAMMHGGMMVHRDLKPGNILMRRDAEEGWTIKICDLGLAVFLNELHPAGGGEPHGTWGYMAPERFGAGERVRPCIDMWSAGCIMAELGMGRPVFIGVGEVDQLLEIIQVLSVPDELSGMELGINEPSTCDKLRSKVPADRLSDDGFKLLYGLLEFDPSRRLTAAQALEMNWFVGANYPPV